MQSLVDRLRSIGSELTDQDLVLYTLQGLGSEYENFVIAFSMCHTNSSIVDLQSLVLAHEARLQVSLPLINSPSAHIATSTQSNNYNSTPETFLTFALSSKQFPPSSYHKGSQVQHNFYNSRSYRGKEGPRGRGCG
jgi:gag-polypeptide of LTR copia-type